jgi:Tfp pilus assembly protein PilZ
VEYRSEAAFRREFAQNISKGGIFVPSRHQIEMREPVELELQLAFADRSVILPGEVVHCIPPEMAESGAQPGVAIQFLMGVEELRAKLDGFSGPDADHVDEQQLGTGRRVAPRWRAHVPAELEVEGDRLEGHTRNVSTSGVLIALPGEVPPVGRRVKVRIRLQSARDQMKVPGMVARHLQAAGLTCVGIAFQVPEARQPDVAVFMDRVRAVEHARRLGGINGPIADLGIRSVLGMFGSTAPEGMLTLTRDDEEGYIIIDDGMLRAQVGLLHGREALDELLSWHEGSFAFEGQADETLVSGETIPVSEVVGEAGPAVATAADWDSEIEAPAEDDELVLMDLEELDSPVPPQPESEGAIDVDEEGLQLDDAGAPESEEGFQLGRDGLALDDAAGTPGDGFVPDDDHSLGDFVLDDREADEIEARLQVETAPIDLEATLVATGRGDRSELGKTEEALLDLAAVGMTVAKALEIIPEPDDQIHAALRTLLDEDFLTLD